MAYKRQLVKTSDGSYTLYVPELDETYHSTNGAIIESKHVFLDKGLKHIKKNNISILEIGFGTGLNCIVTFEYAKSNGISINYTGVEGHPVSIEEINQLNYTENLNSPELDSVFEKIHQCKWEDRVEIDKDFILTKQNKKFSEINDLNCYDLIYFDAFAPEVQPDLWTEQMFKKMYDSLKKDGVLTTYSAKGIVRRAMQSVGFTVERLAGPPGKLRMLRAIKL